jgi:hypothetical protein
MPAYIDLQQMLHARITASIGKNGIWLPAAMIALS